MSLVIEIKINERVLQTVTASRTHRDERVMNTYAVTLYDHEKHTEQALGPLLHAPRLGALHLARKTLEKAVEYRA